MPVRARSFVRHLLHLPDKKGNYAFTVDSNIVILNKADATQTVFLHETGHCMDFGGAFGPKPLHGNPMWTSNYTQDAAVPDAYSDVSVLEDIAQNTVVAAYDLNVEGGYQGVEKYWEGVFHQYSTIESLQREQGDLLIPGGRCTSRLPNSPAVEKRNKTLGNRRRETRQVGDNGSFPTDLEMLEPVEYSTEGICKGGHS